MFFRVACVLEIDFTRTCLDKVNTQVVEYYVFVG